MQSTVSNNNCKKEIPFPKLMTTEAGQIVLFLSYGEGVRLCSGTTDHQIGEYRKTWDMVYFKDFTGSVCLEND